MYFPSSWCASGTRGPGEGWPTPPPPHPPLTKWSGPLKLRPQWTLADKVPPALCTPPPQPPVMSFRTKKEDQPCLLLSFPASRLHWSSPKYYFSLDCRARGVQKDDEPMGFRCWQDQHVHRRRCPHDQVMPKAVYKYRQLLGTHGPWAQVKYDIGDVKYTTALVLRQVTYSVKCSRILW